MTESQDVSYLPRWLWAVVAIEIVVPTFFGIASIVDPSIWDAETLGTLGQLYVTRNLAMAFGVLLAALLRSRAALLVAIAARYATDFVDIVAGFVRGPESDVVPILVVSAVLLLVVPLFGLNWLRRHL
ncbi:MAG: hypothetical protein AAGD35_16800 [Actinomycetota bacterium]